MVKKLIFFTTRTLTERDFKRFQFRYFLKEKFKITVCNLAVLFEYEKVISKPYNNSLNHKNLNNYESLISFLCQPKYLVKQ